MLGSTQHRFKERKMSDLRPFNDRVRLTVKGGVNRMPLE
jgi:hypothetical protein